MRDWLSFWNEKGKSKTDFQATGRGLMRVSGYLFTVAEIARLLDLETQDRLVDVGCGAGLIPLSLSPWVESIKAFDISPTLLDRARKNLLGVGNVTCDFGELCSIPIPDSSADKLLAYSVLQYLDSEQSIVAAMREVYRVLKPGGCALFGANPDPTKRKIYEQVIIRNNQELEAAKLELALMNDVLWVAGERLISLAERQGFEARVIPINKRIWQHFYMFDLVVKKVSEGS